MRTVRMSGRSTSSLAMFNALVTTVIVSRPLDRRSAR
jgi:hypothetical protein